MDTEKNRNMDTPKRQKEKSLAIGLVALISVILILSLIGFFLLEPGPEIIQGQASPNGKDGFPADSEKIGREMIFTDTAPFPAGT